MHTRTGPAFFFDDKKGRSRKAKQKCIGSSTRHFIYLIIIFIGIPTCGVLRIINHNRYTERRETDINSYIFSYKINSFRKRRVNLSLIDKLE